MRELIFAVTRVTDASAHEAITTAWRERGELDGAVRRGYPTPEPAKVSRRAMLAWVLLTMAQDEPNFFAFGALAVAALPLFALLTLVSVLLQRA